MKNLTTCTAVKCCRSISAMLFLLAASQLGAQTQVKPQDVLRAHAAWVKQTTPGTSLEAKQVLREGSIVQYHLFASGLPPNDLYQVVAWPVTDPAPRVSMEGVSIGKDGIVMCAGREPNQCSGESKKDDPIEFSFNPAKGEPFRLALVSSTSRVAIVLVPMPIEGKDKGCTISIIRLTPRFELAYATGTGFPASSEIQFDTQSYGEKHPITATTDANGILNFAMLPFVTGHTKGTTSVKAVGGQCSPSLKFDWGE